MKPNEVTDLPKWVPLTYKRYLAHTCAGQTIRELARREACHASTILRQVRRVEGQRDNPLVDTALSTLEECIAGDCDRAGAAQDSVSESELIRVLRRLCETGSVLAFAEGTDHIAVLRSGSDGNLTRTASVSRLVAERLSFMEWISCAAHGRVRRYHINALGRAALSQLLAKTENAARENLETGHCVRTSTGNHVMNCGDVPKGVRRRQRRQKYYLAENPMVSLSRRKDRDGQAFLSADLVRAGERLREDFELSQLDPNEVKNWDRFVAHQTGAHGIDAQGFGRVAARERVALAMAELGPGLSDVALRCCCFLEGLEVAEKALGWSARSGKIVLRIALQRLKRHYSEQPENQAMIG